MKFFFTNFCFIGLLSLSACSVNNQSSEASPISREDSLVQSENGQSGVQTNAKAGVDLDSNVVWAANIGGAAHFGKDGIRYSKDSFDSSTKLGVIETIKGAQDTTVYQSYRVGNIQLKQALPNGYYDIVFRFAEPDEIDVGARVFDVVAEGKTVISALDVKLARDGNSKSSLDRAAKNIIIDDGVLDIELNSIKGLPILSAIVVRSKQPRLNQQWEMVWSDEFDYEGAPDSAKWSHDEWPAGKVNDEQQQYTKDLENVRVADGKLIIEAHAGDGKISSGRIHTANKGDLHYGRVEVRARLPKGQGTWPAIWMLPTDPFRYASTCDTDADWQGSSNCDAWPNSGEIDIMEHVGYDHGVVHGTVHTKAFYWVNGEQRKASIYTADLSEEFHVYAMEWSEDRIDVFLDDVLYFTYLKQSDSWQEWPFDHPFHLILNLAVGGGWGGAGGPTDIDAFPTRMEVDYVRMYQ